MLVEFTSGPTDPTQARVLPRREVSVENEVTRRKLYAARVNTNANVSCEARRDEQDAGASCAILFLIKAPPTICKLCKFGNKASENTFRRVPY